jgi:hypothetical protein
MYILISINVQVLIVSLSFVFSGYQISYECFLSLPLKYQNIQFVFSVILHWYDSDIIWLQINSRKNKLKTLTITMGFRSCYSLFVYVNCFSTSLLVLFYFFYWPLCFLSFFDLWILITPLISLKLSFTIIHY